VRLHPRTRHVDGAGAQIRSALWDLQGEFGLTDVEMLRIVLDAASRLSTFLLRAERHPGNPDRRADEACDDDCDHDDDDDGVDGADGGGVDEGDDPDLVEA
jgi:hypothetical protein